MFENVVFKPWVGTDYFTKGFNGKKVLVLGDSHYCGDCDTCGIEGSSVAEMGDCRNLTSGVVEKLLSGNTNAYWVKTFRSFEKALSGKEELSLEESNALWNSVAFYNYIQSAKCSKASENYSRETYLKSDEIFQDVLKDLSPDYVIVWGRKVWNTLTWDGWFDARIPGYEDWKEVGGYEINGKKVFFMMIYHPSRGFSYSEWAPYLKNFLSMDATRITNNSIQ